MLCKKVEASSLLLKKSSSSINFARSEPPLPTRSDIPSAKSIGVAPSPSISIGISKVFPASNLQKFSFSGSLHASKSYCTVFTINSEFLESLFSASLCIIVLDLGKMQKQSSIQLNLSICDKLKSSSLTILSATIQFRMEKLNSEMN